jgi:lipopolysaccharide/colanic/teichoic acid biosynthesis glycosyltransferase
MDLAISAVLVPAAVPLCLLAMIAIRCESPGSPLFTQVRVGRGQRPFRLYKLRTMEITAGDKPSHEVDARKITRVGAFLRRTKLDELPQLLNVLNGTMSLVGPRPCLPTQTVLVAERERRGLFAFLPGVTGPAQLQGIDMSDPVLLARTEADYFFAAGPGQDMVLLWRTGTGGGRGDAALKRF